MLKTPVVNDLGGLETNKMGGKYRKFENRVICFTTYADKSTNKSVGRGTLSFYSNSNNPFHDLSK